MLLDITPFWEGLSTLQKVYWLVAIPSTLFFVIQMVLTFLGGDTHDGDSHFDHDLDSGHAGMMSHFFTIKNLVAFLTIFSWTGLACIEGELALVFVIIISISAGITMMFLMAGMFFFVSKLTYSGTMDFRNAIGHTGDVYLSIPANKGGIGKVQIKVQGTLRTLDAMTDDFEDIKTHSIIEVTEIINENILLVKRVR